jgi:L-ascorbate metabolism protein UlaG (beta-lactamase superfamily)
VESASACIYVSGDNVDLAHVDAVAQRFDVSAALLFVGAARIGSFGDVPLTMTGEQAVKAALILGDCPVIPLHCDGWSHLTETVEDVFEAFAAAGIANRLSLLRPGAGIEL